MNRLLICFAILISSCGPSTSVTTSIINETGGENTADSGIAGGDTGGNTQSLAGTSGSTGGSKGTSTGGSSSIGTSNPQSTGGSTGVNTDPSSTGGQLGSTGGSNSGTGGATQIADPNFTPFPPCTDSPNDPTCSPSKISGGQCPNVNVPDYQTAVQVTTTPPTGPCTAATIQTLYKYINGTAAPAIANCIAFPTLNVSACAAINSCWPCLVSSHAVVGGSAGYWFNYMTHYPASTCSKIVWNMDNCFQQACSDSTTQAEYASCVASVSLPVTPNVPKSGLCYQAYGAAMIAIFNVNTTTDEALWETYTQTLCGK